MTLNVFRFTGLNSALALKAPARCATTGNITLQGLFAIDGVTLQSTDTNLRVLVMNQTDSRQNGLYDAQSGPWTRCADMDSNDDVVYDTRVNVQYGAVNQGQWSLTAPDPITIGTSNMTFSPAVIFEIAWGSLPVVSDPDPINDFIPIIDFDSPTVLGRISPSILLGASLANPSASVGLSVVNGSAATAMRSDAAPALSQAIAPTWTGQHIFNNAITQLGSASQLQWSTDLILTRAAAAALQLGAADANPAIAQTSKVQSATGSNIAGQNWTIIGSLSTGSGTSGDIIFQTGGTGAGAAVQNTATTALTVKGATQVVNVASAGSAAAPSLSVGNATTGVYSVSTTGLGLTVNGALKLDFGITAGGILTSGGLIGGSSNLMGFGSNTEVGIVQYLSVQQGVFGLLNGGNVVFLAEVAVQNKIVMASGTQFGFASSTGDTGINFRAALDTILTRHGPAAFQLGAADAASPVAQTLQVQSVVAGNGNTAGVNWTLKGSLSNGAGLSGDIIIQTGDTGAGSGVQNAQNTAITLKGGTAQGKSGSVVLGSAAIATNATDGFLYIPTCAGNPTGTPTTFTGRVALVWDTTNHKFLVYDSGWKGATAPGVWS